MYACIYHINFKYASLFKEQTFFEQTKKQKVADSPHEACSATYPG